MTTDDNSTAPPWLQGHPVEGAADHDDSPAKPSHRDPADESAGGSGHEGAEEIGHSEPVPGLFPPVPDPFEQNAFQPGPPPGYEQIPPFVPPGQPGFPPPGPPGFQPPMGPPPGFAGYPPGGYAPAPESAWPPPGADGWPQAPQPIPYDPNFPPPGMYPGPAGPPPNGELPMPGYGEPPAPGYGEVRQDTPYGEVRQEIGPDGLVRRVFPEEPPRAPEHGTGAHEQQPDEPITSWAPPPLPPQPMYQPPQPPPGWPGAPGQPPVPPAPQGFQQQFPHSGAAQSVNDLNLLKRSRRAPRSGWRRAVHRMSGGAINPGDSTSDLAQRELVDRVNQPVRGDYRIAILSLKGGVGKTTTTVGLGSTFASLRGDRVIAIDANPDLGTLAHRVPRQTRSTVRNLLEDSHISRYSDVRAHTSQSPSRLEVLASEQDPAVSEAFSEDDYRRAIAILQQFYNIILTDCGTGLMHSAMKGVLDLASSLVLVTSPAIDGARSASATLDWLEHHGYGKLVERTVVVVNASRRGASTVDLDQLRKLFLDRTRAVQVVPFDDHLAEGSEIDLELVGKPTRRALLELAAMVADEFGFQLPPPPYSGGPGPQYGSGYPGSPGSYSGPGGGYPGQQYGQ
ncbi:MinD/ParA family ATP-binding protein [Nocardia sp. alder85J]|uniref:MinD/ParA family ATP-binding protein n=1 Tax=Nocardia sp. alder85J TaxID=2862949 RepID=UPI001CD21EF3|nr:AAA family ATPase [Nocardia sp. alder85J]MCX4093724.1 AAA family ATPase [Nocardia sp. alder85J]